MTLDESAVSEKDLCCFSTTVVVSKTEYRPNTCFSALALSSQLLFFEHWFYHLWCVSFFVVSITRVMLCCHALESDMKWGQKRGMKNEMYLMKRSLWHQSRSHEHRRREHFDQHEQKHVLFADSIVRKEQYCSSLKDVSDMKLKMKQERQYTILHERNIHFMLSNLWCTSNRSREEVLQGTDIEILCDKKSCNSLTTREQF